MEEEIYHIPVLLDETLDGLNVRENGVYVDLTFGGGGHSRAILERLGRQGRLYAFDQDEDAMRNVPDDERLTFVRSNFCYLKNFLRYYGVERVDGILADLGVSSHHFDDEERGFSFRYEGRLDMRMNARGGMTAADVLNRYSEAQLADMFFYYGELQQARRLAAAVVRARTATPFAEIAQFMDVVRPLLPKEREKKDMAKVFQALRIEVNREMDVLKRMLAQVPDVLCQGGRLAVLTYHSLEDRIVKNFIKAGNPEGRVEKDFYGRPVVLMRAVNNRVIVPTEDEVARNSRARSAKLRVAERL